MQALIFKKRVVQISDVAFPVAPEMSWVDLKEIDLIPQVGWLYEDNAFSEPPSPPDVVVIVPPPIYYTEMHSKDGKMTKKVYLDDTGKGFILED